MKWKIAVWPVGILIIGFVVMQLLLNSKEDTPERKPQVRPKMVSARIIELSDVPSQIVAFGRLKTAQPVLLYSEVSGIMMDGTVPFQPAQSFKRGDLLLKIDDRQILLDLNSAKSDFLTALASVLPEFKVDFPDEYAVWQNYFNKCGFDKELEPLPETDNQKIKLFLARFNVYKFYFQVRNIEIRLNKHYFYAPFNGSIISTDLRVGSTARVGSKLGEIINLDNLEVEVPVPAQDIQWIDRSRSVIFTSSEIPGEWKGRIIRIGKNIDERTQTVQVFMTVDKNGNENLYNGVFLKAEIPGLIIPHAFSIPRKALYSEKYVYLIKNGLLHYSEVHVARRETNSVILNEGIKTGDTLVVDVLQGVASGMPAVVRHNNRGEIDG